jgi:hypothetical protein
MAIRSDEITSIIKASIESWAAPQATPRLGTGVVVGAGQAPIFGD